MIGMVRRNMLENGGIMKRSFVRWTVMVEVKRQRDIGMSGWFKIMLM
jgi:hypothetical protein